MAFRNYERSGMKPLYKTTIIIWSEDDPTNRYELSELAREAEFGEAYCSHLAAERIADPEKDPHWDGTDFFDDIDVGEDAG